MEESLLTTDKKSKTYDMLKVIITILVVVGHVTRMYTEQGVIDMGKESNVLTLVTGIFYSFHMPLFMGISGMVYGMCIDDFKKYDNIKKFILSKAKRLLIPYFCFGLFWVTPTMINLKLTEQSIVEYFIKGIVLAQNNRHLWFLFVLFWIFIIFHTTRRIWQKINVWIVLLGLVVVMYLSGKLPGIFNLNMAFEYSLFFFMGYEYNKNFFRLEKVFKNPIFMIVALFIEILVWRRTGFIFYIIKALLGSGLVIGLVSYIVIHRKDNKLYNKMRENGFGIYLFHSMFIYIIFYCIKVLNINVNPYINCLIVAILSYLLSFFMTEIVRKLKLKIIIGE